MARSRLKNRSASTNVPAAQARIGEWVFQKITRFFPHMTVAENLGPPAFPRCASARWERPRFEERVNRGICGMVELPEMGQRGCRRSCRVASRQRVAVRPRAGF